MAGLGFGAFVFRPQGRYIKLSAPIRIPDPRVEPVARPLNYIAIATREQIRVNLS